MPRIDPIQNFRFRVEIDSITQAGFMEVEMPEMTVDVIEYREGTDPKHVRKLSGMTKYSNITLKQGITDDMELFNWIKSVAEEGASANRKNMGLVLIDEAGNDRMRWVFEEAWPVKYKVADLNSKGNEVAIEILEIAFESFKRIS